jgi:hypothetical protein
MEHTQEEALTCTLDFYTKSPSVEEDGEGLTKSSIHTERSSWLKNDVSSALLKKKKREKEKNI